jgi:hypothetical protein
MYRLQNHRLAQQGYLHLAPSNRAAVVSSLAPNRRHLKSHATALQEIQAADVLRGGVEAEKVGTLQFAEVEGLSCVPSLSSVLHQPPPNNPFSLLLLHAGWS